MPLLLTDEEIMSFEHFHEAVIKGGMPQRHYARLCAHARAYIAMMAEVQDDDNLPESGNTE